MTDSSLLRTGQAAQQLGVSRQHVVDLCDSGRLPFLRVGIHRRIRAEDLEAFQQGTSALNKEALRSLWYHRAIASHVAKDPSRALESGRNRLAELLAIHPSGMANHWLQQWQSVLDGGAEAVMTMITSSAPLARELRANSIWTGLLSPEEREMVLSSFNEYWREQDGES